MTVSIKREFTVISGTQNIGLSIYDSPPPSGTTFAITGGRDQDLFTIDPATGSLSFRSAKFYQSPQDFDRNGIYDVVITATESDETETSSSIGIEVSLDKVLPEFKDNTISYEVNADGATIIKIAGKLTDDLSGMDGGRVGITLKHAISGQTINLTNSDNGDVTFDLGGNYEVKYTMDAGLPNGMWYVSYLLLEDKAGNSSYITYTGYDSSILSADIPNGLYLGSTDKVLPEFKDNTISYEVNADGATIIKIAGKLTDDLSGMDGGRVGITLKHAISGQTINLTNSDNGDVTFDLGGNYEVKYTMDAGLPNGMWYVSYLLLEDKAGNSSYITYTGYDSSILSADIPNGLYLGTLGGSPDSSIDFKAPVISNLSASVETNSSGNIEVKVIGEVEGDLASLVLKFRAVENPSAPAITFYPVTIGEVDLSAPYQFEGAQTIGANIVSGTYYLDQWYAYDVAGNRIENYITSGGTGSPLLGLGFELNNPAYIEDFKAPVISNLSASVETNSSGNIEVKVIGEVEGDLASLVLKFRAVENPSAPAITFYPVTIGEVDLSAPYQFEGAQTIGANIVSGTYYLDQWYAYDVAGNRIENYITSGGTGSPLLGVSFLVADDPTDIKFSANSVGEKTEGFLLGELVINDNDNDGASSGPTAHGTYAYNTNHLYTYEITGEDKGLIEISSFGYLRIKSDAKVYRHQDQTLDFNITATSPAGVSYTEAFSIPVEAYQHTITYSNGTKTLPGLKLTMTESDGTFTELTADSDGKLTLPTTSNTYSLIASYEGSGNDPISLVDAIQILQYGGELRTFDAAQLKAADVNADGEVDVLDAIWILQHLGELRTLDTDFMFLDGATGKALSETTFNPEDTPDIKIIRKGDVDGDFEPAITNASAASFESSSIDIGLDYDESLSFDNISDNIVMQDPEMDLNDLIDITPEAEVPYQIVDQEFNTHTVNIENYKDPIFQKTNMVFIEEPKENEILIYPDLI